MSRLRARIFGLIITAPAAVLSLPGPAAAADQPVATAPIPPPVAAHEAHPSARPASAAAITRPAHPVKRATAAVPHERRPVMHARLTRHAAADRRRVIRRIRRQPREIAARTQTRKPAPPIAPLLGTAQPPPEHRVYAGNLPPAFAVDGPPPLPPPPYVYYYPTPWRRGPPPW
jgi:hypothetical protein